MQLCQRTAPNFASLWGTRLISRHFTRHYHRQNPMTRSTFLTQAKRSTTEIVVPSRSYNLPIGFLGLGAVTYYTTDNVPLSALFGILGIFLGIQASRVKFIFTKDTLEVDAGTGKKEENVFVGGENKWKFSSFVNWEFWWPSFPILVYFKETQTKPEGQIHFFPILFNGKEIYEVMVERCGSSKTSLPSD
eukprot:g5590.t1